MELIFINQGGYSQEQLNSILWEKNNTIAKHILFDSKDLPPLVESKDKILIFTEFSEITDATLEFLKIVKSINRRVIFINKVSRGISGSKFLEIGYDYCFDSDDYHVINFIIKAQIKIQQEKHERDMLLGQLESSFRELQFQKFALDQSAIVTISDKNGFITYVNEKFCQVTGYSSNEVIGKDHNFLNAGKHNPDMWSHSFQEIKKGNVWKGEVQNIKKDGNPIWMELTVVPFFNEIGEPYKFVAIQFDITYRVLAEKQLTHDAFYDPHTGLPNRSLFLAKIEEFIGKIHLNRNLHLSVVIININQFNRINNIHGFLFGDKVLVKLSEILNQWDTGTEYFPSRIGGDSFGILLIDEGLKDGKIQTLVNEFKQKFDSPLIVDGEEVFIHFSIGIANWDEGGRDGEELVKNAELAMFGSKEDNSLDYVVFEKQMMYEIQTRVRTHAELKQSVKNKDFISYFQPIYSSSTGLISGFESLARWNHPEKGILSPFHFLEEAEESGVIVPISDIIYKQSLDFLKKCSELYPFENPIFLSLNLSSYQFQESLVSYMKAIVTEKGIDPKHVHLEITESLAMKDFSKTFSILEQFQENNFSISLDDFGTGYSSLSYLKIFPINHLKIDKSFVDDIATNPQDRSILNAIVLLGKNLGLKIIAEGVETREQFDILCDMQVDFIQGYFYSKPLTEGEALELLQKSIAKTS